MQTQRAGNMHKLRPEKGILGHNYSLALLRMKYGLLPLVAQ